MSRITRRTAIALLASFALVPAVLADHSPLSVVPASSPLVVQLHGIDGSKDRLLALLRNALPELVPEAESFFDKALKGGEFTQGRKPRGLAKNGPMFAVFNEIPKLDSEPKMAFVLAITKYEEFRDNVLSEDERKTLKTDAAGYQSATLGFGEAIFFVNKKEFVVVTPFRELAEAYTKEQKGIDSVLSKEHSAKLLASDVSAYLSLEAINKEFGDQLKQQKDSFVEWMKNFTENFDKSQRGNLLLIQKLIEPAFQAFGDSKGLLLTIDFRPQGLAAHLEAELRPGTPTALALEASKRSTLKGLNRLPAGQSVYFGMEASPLIATVSGGLMFGVAVDPDDPTAKAAQSALSELISAGPSTRLDAFGDPSRSLQVAHFKDPAKAVAAQVKLVQTLVAGSAYAGGLLKDKPKVTPKAKNHGDFEFTSVELTWDLEKMASGTGGGALPDDAKHQLAERFKKLLGEKQTIWIGTDGKIVLQVTAPDWAKAEELLDKHVKDGDVTGKLAAFQDVRKELPAETNLLALVDVVRYVGVTLDLYKPLFEDQLSFRGKIPAAPAKAPPTFSGVAATLKPGSASVDVFLSAATVRAVYKTYILPMMTAPDGAAN